MNSYERKEYLRCMQRCLEIAAMNGIERQQVINDFVILSVREGVVLEKKNHGKEHNIK